MALRRRVLLVAIATVAMLAVASAFALDYELSRHMYPQDALHQPSNLDLKGVVHSVEERYISHGFAPNSYHIFRWFITLNITEILWAGEDYLNSSIVGDTFYWNTKISVGYDYLDKPQISIGQEIECRGFYLGVTDLPYSSILTVAPSVNGCYLKPQSQIFNVEIADFNWTSDWAFGPVGTSFGRRFAVTLRNLENRNIEGLNLEVKLLADNIAIWSQTWLRYSPTVTFDLSAGEIHEFEGAFMTNIQELDAQGEKMFMVRVNLGDATLDWLQLPFT